MSLENHCGLNQQRRMAEVMKEIFNDKLVLKAEETDLLPSPEDLKGKILIKVLQKYALFIFFFVVV